MSAYAPSGAFEMPTLETVGAALDPLARKAQVEYYTRLTTQADRQRVQVHTVDSFNMRMAHYVQNGLIEEFPYTLKEVSTRSGKYSYNPRDPYMCSNVCFEKKVNWTSSKRTKKIDKMNTYILCPYCDPFAKLNDNKKYYPRGTKKTTIGGETEFYSEAHPIHCFHDTLASEFVKHMANAHGVFRDSVAVEPFLGLLGNEHSLALKIVCPYATSRGSHVSPCMCTFNYNTKSNEGFKSYYRHVKECHIGSKSCASAVKASSSDLFIPLSDHEFNITMDYITDMGMLASERLFKIVNEQTYKDYIGQTLGGIGFLDTQSLDETSNVGEVLEQLGQAAGMTQSSEGFLPEEASSGSSSSSLQTNAEAGYGLDQSFEIAEEEFNFCYLGGTLMQEVGATLKADVQEAPYQQTISSNDYSNIFGLQHPTFSSYMVQPVPLLEAPVEPQRREDDNEHLAVDSNAIDPEIWDQQPPVQEQSVVSSIMSDEESEDEIPDADDLDNIIANIIIWPANMSVGNGA